VGAIANTARRAGVHTHWMFCFALDRHDDVEAAVARVRALGGTAFDPVALPDGRRLAACEDAQGGAFGVMEVAAAAP
jgi:predicted enzyme related to lactoylglutathione lyase